MFLFIWHESHYKALSQPRTSHVRPVENLNQLCGTFPSGGGDSVRKSYCVRNNQPDTLVPAYSRASLQLTVRGQARSSVGAQKALGLAISPAEICLKFSPSSVFSYCSGRFPYPTVMWCFVDPTVHISSCYSVVWIHFFFISSEIIFGL